MAWWCVLRTGIRKLRSTKCCVWSNHGAQICGISKTDNTTTIARPWFDGRGWMNDGCSCWWAAVDWCFVPQKSPFNTDIKAPVTFDGRVKVFGTNRARLFTPSNPHAACLWSARVPECAGFQNASHNGRQNRVSPFTRPDGIEALWDRQSFFTDD